MDKNALNLSTMVGENFEIYLSQMVKMHLNYPPLLEKILKFTCHKLLKMHLNYPPWIGEIFEIYLPQTAKNAL